MEVRRRTAVTTALVAGLLAGYGIAMPVGAVATWLVGLTARTSLRTGLSAALGVATADGMYAGIAVIGGTALAGLIAPVAGPLRAVAAMVLLVVAARGALGALREHRRGVPVRSGPVPGGAMRAYLTLLGMTVLNPTTVLYFTALVVGGHVVSGVPVVDRVGFVLAAFLASASWQALLVGGGAVLGATLTGRRGRLVTALVSSAVIAALALRLAATG